MPEDEERLIAGTIAKLEIRDGDALVFTSGSYIEGGPATERIAMTLTSILERMGVTKYEIILLGPGDKLEVLRRVP